MSHEWTGDEQLLIDLAQLRHGWRRGAAGRPERKSCAAEHAFSAPPNVVVLPLLAAVTEGGVREAQVLGDALGRASCLQQRVAERTEARQGETRLFPRCYGVEVIRYL